MGYLKGSTWKHEDRPGRFLVIVVLVIDNGTADQMTFLYISWTFHINHARNWNKPLVIGA